MKLSPDDVEAVARRVVELLQEGEVAPRVGMVGTAAIARMVGMSEDWVRDHAGELGGVRAGDGARGELRFDVAVVRERMARRGVAADQLAGEPRRPGPRPPARKVRLLPLPEGAR